jgi:hypothetical protein
MMRKEGFWALAVAMAERTGVWASSQLVQNPVLALQVGQIDVGTTGNSTLAIQFLRLLDPLRLSTINSLLLSTATKPVISVRMLFSNSERVLVSTSSHQSASFFIEHERWKVVELRRGKEKEKKGIQTCGFDPRAVSLRTGYLSAGGVVVTDTICRCGVLAEELETVEYLGGNGSFGEGERGGRGGCEGECAEE